MAGGLNGLCRVPNPCHIRVRFPVSPRRPKCRSHEYDRPEPSTRAGGAKPAMPPVRVGPPPLTVTAPGQQPQTRGEPVTVPLYPRNGGRPLQRWTREDCRTSRAWHNLLVVCPNRPDIVRPHSEHLRPIGVEVEELTFQLVPFGLDVPCDSSFAFNLELCQLLLPFIAVPSRTGQQLARWHRHFRE